MSKIKEIPLSDGSCIYVEMEEADIPEIPGFKPAGFLSEGTELRRKTGDKAVDTMQVLKNTINAMINMVYEGVKESKPDEWTLELNIGFKGKTTPIPVILGGNSNVAMKVIAKWKKPETSDKKIKQLSS